MFQLMEKKSMRNQKERKYNPKKRAKANQKLRFPKLDLPRVANESNNYLLQ